MNKTIMVFLILSSTAFAAPDFKLPLPDGERWLARLAYNSDPFHHGKDKYAIDFTQTGCDAWRKDANATARGIVTKTGYSGSYGNYVIVDHGDNYTSRYAHLDSITVSKGTPVCQGCSLGKIGRTGTGIVGNACAAHPGTHLHFAVYLKRKAYKPEPISGYRNITAGTWYTSDNNLPDGIYLGHPDFVKKCIETIPFNSQCNIEDIVWYQDCISEKNSLCVADGSGGGGNNPPPNALPDFITPNIWLEDTDGDMQTLFEPGQRIKMKAQFKNIGADSPKDVKVEFYFSTGRKVDRNPKRVGKDKIKKRNMKTGDTKTETEGMNAPEEEGRYNITACPNPKRKIKEQHKSNNCSDEAIFEVGDTTPRVVDLIITNIAITNGPVTPGGLYGATMTIQNIGPDTPREGFRSRYLINGPGTNGQWQQIADDGSDAGQLAPGSSQIEQINSLVIAPLVTGDYLLRACADYLNDLVETDEDNNCMEVPFTIEGTTVPNGPNFIITRIEISGGATSVGSNQAFNPELTVKNVGNVNSPSGIRSAYYIRGPQTGGNWAYVDDDGTDANQLCAGCQYNERINVGTSISQPGQYELRACADYLNSVTEADEGDNCMISAPFQVN